MNRAGARVYAVDTRGLAGAPADTINSLAVDTGGFAIFNESNIGRALKRPLQLTPASTTCSDKSCPIRGINGKDRRIEVKVQQPDVRVRARKGYLAIDIFPECAYPSSSVAT